MHGRTDSWMDRWMYRWTYRWMEGQMGRRMDRHKDVHRNRWTPPFYQSGQKKRIKIYSRVLLAQTDKQIDRQTDRQTEGQTNKRTKGHTLRGAYGLRDIPPSALLSVRPSNKKTMRIDFMIFSLFLTRSAVQNAHWFCCPRSLIF